MAKTILIVDDEYGMIEVLTYRLKDTGYDVFSASSGNEALQTCKNIKPDLVLLDVLLPDCDGWQVCEKMKADESIAHIPIIMITAALFAENIAEKVKKYKAQGFAIKPFDSEELLKMIADLLAGPAA